jgi:hypothetical protein
MHYILKLTDEMIEIKRKIQKPVFPNEEIISFDLWIDGIQTEGNATIIHYSDHSTTLDGIGLPPELRDRKLSNLIMQKVVEEIDSKNNVGLLSLTAVNKGVPKLQDLYQKYGFEPCSKLKCRESTTFKGEKHLFCQQYFIRESKTIKKGSKEYQYFIETWCEGKVSN